jgi:hypothetical protein
MGSRLIAATVLLLCASVAWTIARTEDIPFEKHLIEEVGESAFSDLRAPLQEQSRNSPTETAVRPRVGRAVSFI